MTPSERLREAARLLREPCGPRWWRLRDLDAPLSDWLTMIADDVDAGAVMSPLHPAVRVADAVLGAL